jgi:hypothetical protein
MTGPTKQAGTTPHNLPDEAQAGAAQNPPAGPAESEDHGMERQPGLGRQIAAHTNRPHKGDVGRPGTNEEVFQGSKTKELS